MTRLYGRARHGARCVGSVPHGHWRTSTFICGLRRQDIIAPLVIPCPMNGTIFLDYVKGGLSAELREGDIVVMDNLSAHKNPAVRKALEANGVTTFYLPPYSPDMNPIEMAFAKLKALLRAAGERTVDDLWRRLKPVLEAFTPQDCENFFKHAGYA